MSRSRLSHLHELARLYRVQQGYLDVEGRRQQAAPEALLQVLQVLGAPMDDLDDAPDALRARRAERATQVVEPVIVSWEGRTGVLALRQPRARTGRVSCALHREDGEVVRWQLDLDTTPAMVVTDVEGVAWATRRTRLPEMPLGYHRLEIEAGGERHESTIIAAPRTIWRKAGAAPRDWGVFMPLYALHSERSWGLGDLTDLEHFMDWGAQYGASLFGTLPLLAAYLDEPYSHSPYSPVSRLFWNELYADPTAAPEFERSEAARAIASAPEFQGEIRSLADSDLVDYGRAMALKRKVLEALAKTLFEGDSRRQSELDAFLARNPRVRDYALFRAVTEERKESWHVWPERQRAGDLTEADADPALVRYHLYVQWLVQEQLKRLADKARTGGDGLYLDLPVGVNPDGYDIWRERDAFAVGLSAGAPPDPFFTGGQDWGFPPLHPIGSRRQGHRYFRDSVRAHLAFAGRLRIDHVMMLHRMYWVPSGLGPKEGVYVRYPAEEQWAVLTLESHRHGSRVVGENLGTVPPSVNRSMKRHGAQGMYVGQFAIGWDPGSALNLPEPGVLASPNTHDLPPWHAWWHTDDVTQRVDLGFLDPDHARGERDGRAGQKWALAQWLKNRGLMQEGHEDDPHQALLGVLSALGESEAAAVLMNLEDLWGERSPQNVPGTYLELPNWQRKARHSFEVFRDMPAVTEALRNMHLRRNGRGED